MKKDQETSYTGWSFIVAALLLWSGYMLSSHHTGEYLEIADFNAIGENVWYWIWMFRVHIFGWVIMGAALFALAALTAKKPYRVYTLSGIGVTIVGTFTIALGAAFYYSYGAWGVGQIEGNTVIENEVFIDKLTFTNHYATCLVRFGRIFSGVGLLILGFALVKWKIVQSWLGVLTMLLGLTAICVILFIHSNFEIYKPLFHVKVLWLVLMGVTLLRRGLQLEED